MDLIRWPLFVTLIFTGALTLHAQIVKFVVSQVHPQLPVMTAYCDILDASGRPPANLLPANFSARLGTNAVTVPRVRRFQETSEPVAYTFLLDVSKSISPEEFSQMQSTIGKALATLKPGDWAALCTFGDDYRVVAGYKRAGHELDSALNGLASHDMHTHLYQAVHKVLEQAKDSNPQLPVRRVVVLLSDGKDEGSGISLPEILNQLHTTHIPVYVIGYSRLPGAQKQQYLSVLRQFAEASGGLYVEPVADNFQQAYSAVQDAIQRVFVVDLSCPACVADGAAHPLFVSFKPPGEGAPASLGSGLRVIPLAAAFVPPPHPSPAPVAFWQQPWIWLAGLAALAAVALARFLARRKPDAKPPEPGPVPPVDPELLDHSSAKVTGAKGIPMKLTVVKGASAGRVYDFLLAHTITIGRAKECDVVLDDARASNRHCQLELSSSAVIMYDLDSKNNTYVKGVPILGRHKMENEDSLLIGDTELRLRFSEDEVLGR